MNKAVLTLLVVLCMRGTMSYADDTRDNVEGLIAASESRSGLQMQSCSQMLLLHGDRYVCGFLRVPENYASKKSKLINIPFLVIQPDERIFDKALEPLLVTGGGGPGSAMLGGPAYQIVDDEFWTYEEFSVADGRALMILENRGVGLSQPNLDCHYRPDIFRLNFWSELLNTDFSCGREYLSDGVDLSQYNARNAALDIEMFRRLYGSRGVNTKQLNLYGISYGTRVAMYYERLFPRSTRAMVLDSVSVIEQNSLGTELEYGQRSFDLVFSKCRLSTVCRERFGAGLEDEFYRFLSEVDSRNISMLVNGPDSHVPVSVPLTGSLIVNVVHGMLYSSDTIATVPLTLKTMINGSYGRVTIGVEDYLYTYSSQYNFSDSAFLTYRCFDEDYSGKTGRDFSEIKLYKYWDLKKSRKYMQSVCAEYGIVAEVNRWDTRPTSDTPTLFLSGELDPVTPPATARRAAEKSSYHWDVVRKNVSHDVISHSSCARLLASWFIYHPQEDLDKRLTDCEPPVSSIEFLVN